MTRRAPPGMQVAAGRIRVDAARAIAKLREFQLANRSAWVLEVIRAAVASGAATATLIGDSDDLWCAWAYAASARDPDDRDPDGQDPDGRDPDAQDPDAQDPDGPPAAGRIPAAALPRIFDELVSPEATAARQHLRLLGSGVNGALGLEPAPAFVDVYTRGQRGIAHRARFTPAALDDDTLRALVAVRIDPGAADGGDPAALRTLATHAPGGGAAMLVHVHRRASVAVVARFMSGGEQPELELARRACADLPIPIAIGRGATPDRGTPFGRTVPGPHGADRDLVRIPLGEDFVGFVAITDPPPVDDLATVHNVAVPATFEFAERGVVLAHRSLDVFASPAGPTPIRVLLDLPRLPTDASRSQVRKDAYPIPQAIARARALIGDAIAALAARLRATPDDARARAAALALIRAEAGSAWASGGGACAPLAALPLLRDAVGDPHPVASAWTGDVHAGARALPAELGAWIPGILWSPAGDDSRRLLAGAIDSTRVHARVRTARRRHAARARFLAHAPRTLAAIARRAPRVRMPLAALRDTQIARDAPCLAYLHAIGGEICVHAEPGVAEITLVWCERELAHASVASPIAFDALLAYDALTPTDDYRGVEPDAAHERARAVLDVALAAAVEYAVRAAPPPRGVELGPPTDADAALVRRALAVASTRGLRARGPLADAPAWPQLDGPALTLTALRAARGVGVALPGATLPALPDRPIVIVADDERGALERALTHAPVPYRTTQLPPRARDLADALAATTRAVALAIASPDTHQVEAIAPVAYADASRLDIRHRGVTLVSRTYVPSLLPCAIVIDSEVAIPTATWSSARDLAGLAAPDFLAYEARLVRALLAAFAGDRDPDLYGVAPLGFGTELGDRACAALADAPTLVGLTPALRALLRAVPLVALVGNPDRRSLDELAPQFAAALEWVEPGTRPAPGYVAIETTEVRARALAVLLDKPARDGTVALEVQRARFERDARLARLRARPVEPFVLPPALHAGGPTVAATGPIVRAGVVGLARDATPRIVIAVVVEDRVFDLVTAPCDLPLVAAFAVDVERIDEEFAHVPDDVIAELANTAVRHAPALLHAFALRAPAELIDGRAYPLLAALYASRALDRALAEALRAAPAYRDLRGARVSIDDATTANRTIPVATYATPWLDPAPGEPADPLDGHVLAIATPRFVDLVQLLTSGRAVDVSREVEVLQARRRMSHGLVPTPTLPQVPATLKCALGELGDAGRRLGVGELALSGTAPGRAILHVEGTAVKELALATAPPVLLALEVGSTLSAVAAVALEATLADAIPTLVRRVARARPTLSAAIRAQLATAALLGAIALEDLGELAVFELGDGRVVAADAIRAQLATFRELWIVAEPPSVFSPPPLDPARALLVSTDLRRILAGRNPLGARDGAAELALDARARRSLGLARHSPAQIMARPLIARVELEREGSTAGVVGLLPSGQAAAAQLHPLRDGVALAPIPLDDLPWPAIAAVEDPNLIVDRTYEHVVTEPSWVATVERVRAAATRLVDTIARAPETALVSIAITPEHVRAATSVRMAPTRVLGVAWLEDPVETPAFSVDGEPLAARLGVNAAARLGGSIGAELHVAGATGDDRTRLLERLVANLHVALLARLRQGARDAETQARVIAHVARAIAHHHLAPAAAGDVAITCFAPPLSPVAWLALATTTTPVVVVAPDVRAPAGALIDDGGPLARTCIALLGDRVERLGPLGAAALAPPREPAAPAPIAASPHAWLATALGERLAAIGIEHARTDVIVAASPRDAVLTFERGALYLDLEHRHAHTVARLLEARHPRGAAALDALAAHAVTVLNLALTEITDATEAHAIATLLANP